MTALFLQREKLFASIVTALTLCSCAIPRRAVPTHTSFPDVSIAPQVEIQELEKVILETTTPLEEETVVLTSSEPHGGERPAASKKRPLRIPVEINENVQKWIHYFTVRDRERFERFLKRGSVYRPLVEEILRRKGVPTELYYLAMIESGYVSHARSTAKAVGFWQFISGTGRRYGLRQNRYLDERRDIIRSTEAAAEYLNDLHTVFQSWYLAMASYNAGEGRILGAIMRGGTRDFWALVEKKALPPETRNYVPKFLAAMIIGRNPEKFGFYGVRQTAMKTPVSFEVPRGAPLAAVARLTDIPLSELEELNPQLLKSIAPYDRKTTAIWVPEGSITNPKMVQHRLAKAVVPERRSSSRRIASNPSASRPSKRKLITYRVRKGDALAEIAKKHGITVGRLKRLNRLRSNKIFAGQHLKVARH